MFRFRDIQLLNTKLVMHVISRHLDPIIKACKSFYKWVFSVQLVVASVQRTSTTKGFRSRGNGILFPSHCDGSS